MRRTCLEVSRDAFKNNVLEVKKLIGDALIMPVVKANAYGTYLNKDIGVVLIRIFYIVINKKY